MTKTRLLQLLLLAIVALPAAAAEREVVELIPAQRAGWTIGRLFAPITGLFMGGPSYWYGERTLEIDTDPPGASLDLFYVRENIQQRFERAESPALLELPTRIDAGRRDSILVRAVLDGYLHQEATIDVRSREKQRTIALEPLPNQLETMTHTFLSRRESLKFLTSEAAQFRVHEMSDGFSIVLTQTGHSQSAAESMRGISSDNIKLLRAEQLGEDLVVRVQLHDADPGGLDLRSTRDYDAVRELHHFTVELVRKAGNAAVLARSEDALNRIQREDVFGCALDFDRSMRSQLDPAALSRALVSASGFLDPHLRLALQHLGELSPDGLITLVDGSKFYASVPLDLAAARIQSAEVIGFLSLLRAFIAELEPPEHRRGALRGAIAPELDREHFDASVEIAEDLERSCSTRAPAAQS